MKRDCKLFELLVSLLVVFLTLFFKYGEKFSKVNCKEMDKKTEPVKKCFRAEKSHFRQVEPGPQKNTILRFTKDNSIFNVKIYVKR